MAMTEPTGGALASVSVSPSADSASIDAWQHIEQCSMLLHWDPADLDLSSLTLLDDALAEVRQRLERFLTRPELSPDVRVEACRLLFLVHQSQRQRLDSGCRGNLDAIAGLRETIDDISALTTSELVDQLPATICERLLYSRAMISSVRSAVWMPRHLHIERDDDGPENRAFLAYVDGAHIPLSEAPLETEVVRTRSSTMSESAFNDRRTFQEIVQIAQSSGYVAAPILSNGRVIGMLHADRPKQRSGVGETDLAIISTLAECVSVIFERALLGDRLRLSTARVDELFGGIAEQLGDIGDAAASPPPVTAPLLSGVAADNAPHRPVLRLLTPREHEVIVQMSTGATNAQIARALVISEDTVKSHVKRIFRKLDTNTRAASVSRYAQLTRTSGTR